VKLTTAQALHRAIEAHKAGKLQVAERLYRAILQVQPRHAYANQGLGVLALSAGTPEVALHFLKTALEANPTQGQFWIRYIDTLIKTNRVDIACRVLRQGKEIGLKGEVVDALSQRLSQPTIQQGLRASGKQVASTPTNGPSSCDSSQLAEKGSELASSQPSPSDKDIDDLLDRYNRGQYEIAEKLASVMTQEFPGYQFGWKMLGLVLLDSGRTGEALGALEKSVELNLIDAEAHLSLGFAFTNLRRLEEAEAAYRQAIALKPTYAEAYNNLGNTLSVFGRLSEAEDCIRQALALEPSWADAHNNLGNILSGLGRLAEAIASYRHAIRLNPNFGGAYSNLLFSMNYQERLSPEASLEEALRFGNMASQTAVPKFTSWACTSVAEKLRIGIVSADLKTHPVGFFLEAVIASVSTPNFELFAYSTGALEDELTRRIKPLFSRWRSFVGVNDEVAARRIHEDAPHILIDLSGHTANNRLPIFAYKPAPVQVTWLGYFATTGLKEIDYILGDPYVTPLSEADHFSERIWQLPETYLCFTPPTEAIEVESLPALTYGYLTFGCFNNLAKMNDTVVSLWARVLTQVPGSKLFLKCRHFADSKTIDKTIERFAACGVAADRLIFEAGSLRSDYFKAYHRVDIALDPFPYPGGTTSVEGLWMGVPVITKRGDRFISHIGETIAMNTGQVEWIAKDEEEYVRKAIWLSSDLQGLSRLRMNLRQQVMSSPMFDQKRFVRHFEEAMQGMWAEWLRRHQP
jgi:protein O-GlcNAc transferase